MEILNLSLPAANQFATEYTAGKPDIQQFFHYQYNEPSDYLERLAELKKRPFLRLELAECIEQYMERFPTSSQVANSIRKLKQEDSTVVIGGQQAGILTGPLYTIHKIISIIVLAEQKEKELGVPVVPVFWIAGEDHDFQEVNHVYVSKGKKVEKWTYPERVLEKKMVSDIPLNREVCYAWVKDIVETYGETDHTKRLLKFVGEALDHSGTFVDFFAFMVMKLFKDYGLLIIDSADSRLRRIEKDYFIRQIKDFAHITRSVLDQQEKTSFSGFQNTIEIGKQAANLFYYDHSYNERILLEYDRQIQAFVGKNGAVRFTEAELVEIANEFPERLSNNVVTRPLTQEWLFPTIAFIAGPGEISYWAELKGVFEHFGIKMPPIVPRLNMTILERSVETDMADLVLEMRDVIISGTGGRKAEFIESVKDKGLNELFSQIKEQVKQQYKQIEEKTAVFDKGLIELVNKNENLILKHIEFMESKIEESIRLKHGFILRKYDRIDKAIKPQGSLQERIWNPFYYINQYGFDFIDQLMKLPFKFDGFHKVIKL